jgi:hypothetical protein
MGKVEFHNDEIAVVSLNLGKSRLVSWKSKSIKRAWDNKLSLFKEKNEMMKVRTQSLVKALKDIKKSNWLKSKRDDYPSLKLKSD